MNTLRCLLVALIIYMPAVVLYVLSYFPKVTRPQFATVMCFTVGAQLFVLAVMFVEKLPLVTGLFLFFLAFVGVYPVTSRLYANHKARLERRLSRKT